MVSPCGLTSLHLPFHWPWKRYLLTFLSGSSLVPGKWLRWWLRTHSSAPMGLTANIFLLEPTSGQPNETRPMKTMHTVYSWWSSSNWQLIHPYFTKVRVVRCPMEQCSNQINHRGGESGHIYPRCLCVGVRPSFVPPSDGGGSQVSSLWTSIEYLHYRFDESARNSLITRMEEGMKLRTWSLQILYPHENYPSLTLLKAQSGWGNSEFLDQIL